MPRGSGWRHSPETIARMRQAKHKRPMSQANRDAVSARNHARLGKPGKPRGAMSAQERGRRCGVPVECLDAYYLYRSKGWTRAEAQAQLGLPVSPRSSNRYFHRNRIAAGALPARPAETAGRVAPVAPGPAFSSGHAESHRQRGGHAAADAGAP